MVYLIAKYQVQNTTPSNFSELRVWLLKHRVFAIDSETRPGKFPAEMIMFQIGNHEDQWIIDVRDYDLEQIKTFLTSESYHKIGHNLKYDYGVLRGMNITMNHLWDTMIADQVRYTGLKKPKGFYTLEQTYERYYSENPYGDQLSLFKPYVPKKIRGAISKKGEEPFTWAEISYGATDVESTYKVYQKQLVELAKENLLPTAMFENQYVPVIGDMEYEGFPLDLNEWNRLAVWSRSEMNISLEKLRTLYPEVENWNSHLQIKKLFKSLGINVRDRTGKESVNEKVIKPQQERFPIIGEYLRYQKFKKLATTYGEAFLKHVNEHTGRVHSSFMQILTTGRLSSNSPNLQNIVSASPDFPEGNMWREAFRPKEGYVFIDADYSSQEVRILADKTQDETLLDALRSGKDLHRITAAALFEKPEEQITSEERKIAKINLFMTI